MRLREFALLAALLAAVTIAKPAIAGDDRSRAKAGREAQCSITLEADGSLSASVVDMPVDEVLARLASRTGIVVTWTESRSAARASVSFHRLAMSDAIARLLARYNYTMVLTRNVVGKPRTEVRIGSSIDDATADLATDRSAVPAPAAATAVGAPSRAAIHDREQVFAPAAPDDRARLEVVSRLVDLEKGTEEGSPLRDVLARALARNDAEDVQRATTLGLGALPDDTLEAAARSDDALRPAAVDLLARRAESEPPALAALTRLAASEGDAAAAEMAP